MGTKIELYRKILLALDQWEEYLLEQSGLPGKRANLELLQAVVDIAGADIFRRFLDLHGNTSKPNSREEFLVMCGVTGLGKVALVEGIEVFSQLRPYASSPNWRIREAVAMAIQYYGRSKLTSLISEMDFWSRGSLWEQRAVIAGLCEPDLLKDQRQVSKVLGLIDRITYSIVDWPDRKSEEFKVLRKALGYCWSVAIAARPQAGVPVFRKWLRYADKDIQWIVKENLKKKRLTNIDLFSE